MAKKKIKILKPTIENRNSLCPFDFCQLVSFKFTSVVYNGNTERILTKQCPLCNRKYIHVNSFKDLKMTFNYIFKNLFGEDIKLRYRPSYFPFTEPSTEVDVSCFLCGGKGCNVCKYEGWLEVVGGGMLDPNVLKNANIDPEVYSGFAFGFGLERLAMLLYQIKDIRFFSTNDARFLRQFDLI